MKNDAEMLDKLKERIRKQNEAVKENWDTVSCRLPKGTKDRIKKHGYTVNGLINEAVKVFLDTLEETEEPELEPDQPEPVADPEPEKPVNKNDISVAEAFQILQNRGSGIKEQRERSERAKEARKEVEREETLRLDKDRKTDIRDAIKVVYSPEKEESATSDDPELKRITENMEKILRGE